MLLSPVKVQKTILHKQHPCTGWFRQSILASRNIFNRTLGQPRAHKWNQDTWPTQIYSSQKASKIFSSFSHTVKGCWMSNDEIKTNKPCAMCVIVCVSNKELPGRKLVLKENQMELKRRHQITMCSQPAMIEQRVVLGCGQTKKGNPMESADTQQDNHRTSFVCTTSTNFFVEAGSSERSISDNNSWWAQLTSYTHPTHTRTRRRTDIIATKQVWWNLVGCSRRNYTPAGVTQGARKATNKPTGWVFIMHVKKKNIPNEIVVIGSASWNSTKIGTIRFWFCSEDFDTFLISKCLTVVPISMAFYWYGFVHRRKCQFYPQHLL